MSTPHQPYISILTMGGMVYRWDKLGLSDSSISKMTQLWTGYTLQQFMDEQGRWPRHEFSNMARRLGYRSAALMINDVRRSASFCLMGSSDDDIQLISSPAWHPYNKADGRLLYGSMTVKEAEQNGVPKSTEDNNIIYNPTGSNAEALADMTARSKQEMERDHQVALRIVRDYFTWLGRQTDADHEALRMQMLRCCEGEQHLQFVIDTQLVPYLSGRDEFFRDTYKQSPKRRIYWLRNLLKPNFMKRMVCAAARQWNKHEQHIGAEAIRQQQEAVRRNRPLSPYEWTDADGWRYYEVEGSVRAIPRDAAPRPSDTATWNFISMQWTS